MLASDRVQSNIPDRYLCPLAQLQMHDSAGPMTRFPPPSAVCGVDLAGSKLHLTLCAVKFAIWHGEWSDACGETVPGLGVPVVVYCECHASNA